MRPWGAARGAGGLVAFGAAFRLQLNATKSVRYATSPADQRWLAAQDGPPVRASFKDLGVVQRVGARHGPVRPGDRLCAAYGRLDRIARLWVPYAVRLLLVASSAVAAMMFGAGPAFLALADLAQARRRVYGVLTKRRYRAADDAIAVLYDVPWRPATIEQRIGRVDRVGQQHNVEVYVPYFRSGYEAAILKVMQKSIGVLDRTVGGIDHALEYVAARLAELVYSGAGVEEWQALYADTETLVSEATRRIEEAADPILDVASYSRERAEAILNPMTACRG